YPRVEEAGQALPPPGKVAIEIDAAVVAAGVGGDAVRVEVGDDPEVYFTRWCDVGESAGDRDPRERRREQGAFARFLRREHDLVRFSVVVGRLAAIDRTAEIGAISVDDAAEVEHHGRPLGQRVVRRLGVRREVALLEPGEDMRGE